MNTVIIFHNNYYSILYYVLSYYHHSTPLLHYIYIYCIDLGHLFAIFDALQWHHPLLAKADELRADPSKRNCTTDYENVKHCVPGCPGTRMKRIIVSGYNADTNHLLVKLLLSTYLNQPFQAAPVYLGFRLIPPLWYKTLGWSYSFGACPSNFIDCFFLEHSPCPKIDIEIEHGPGHKLVDRVRWDDIPNFELPDTFDWYKAAVGYDTDVPRHAVDGFLGSQSAHAAYTYLFRPRYFVRKEVHRRVDAFPLESQDTCAIMHVRRGDICTLYIYIS